MENKKKIEALVKLIEDPDDVIYQQIRDELINYGSTVIPFLEKSWESEQYGLLFQSRIEQLIHDIQFNQSLKEIIEWKNSTEKDLLEGSIAIAKLQYPNLDENQIKEKIASIRKSVWLEINENQTAYEKVRILNKVFFGTYGFTGNSSNYHASDNSLINRVLETKKGNPLSLSIIYSVVAQSLDLPIYGVNLPNHFILAYMDEFQIGKHFMPEEHEDYGVLFYINPFSRGSIFDQEEIKEFMKGINRQPDRSCFEPCSNSTIIYRMLTNLTYAFQQSGNAEKVIELKKVQDLF